MCVCVYMCIHMYIYIYIYILSRALRWFVRTFQDSGIETNKQLFELYIASHSFA